MVAKEAKEYASARSIFGEDFITPEMITQSSGVTYKNTQLARIERTLWDKQILEFFRHAGMILVAAPPEAMSLRSIRSTYPEFFYKQKSSDDRGTGREDFISRETVAATDKIEVTSTWIAFQKYPSALSVGGQCWSIWEQEGLMGYLENASIVIPNVAEVAWVMAAYRSARGVSLFENSYLMTRSIQAPGYHVFVANIDGQWSIDYCSDLVGDDKFCLATAYMRLR